MDVFVNQFSNKKANMNKAIFAFTILTLACYSRADAMKYKYFSNEDNEVIKKLKILHSKCEKVNMSVIKEIEEETGCKFSDVKNESKVGGEVLKITLGGKYKDSFDCSFVKRKYMRDWKFLGIFAVEPIDNLITKAFLFKIKEYKKKNSSKNPCL